MEKKNLPFEAPGEKWEIKNYIHATIIVMLQNTQGKGKVLTTRERKSSVSRGLQLSRLPASQEERPVIKESGMIFQNTPRENNQQQRILYPAKLSHWREGKIKIFHIMNWLLTNPHGKRKSKTTYHPGRKECNSERDRMSEVAALGLPYMFRLWGWMVDRWCLGVLVWYNPRFSSLAPWYGASCQLLFIILPQLTITCVIP